MPELTGPGLADLGLVLERKLADADHLVTMTNRISVIAEHDKAGHG